MIPKEIRNNFKIEEGDQIEFFLNNNTITIKKTSDLNGLDDEIYKLFQIYNLKFYNSICLMENGNILIGYGKNLDKISSSVNQIDIQQYNKKSLMRFKVGENNFLISNIKDNIFIIVEESKPSTSIDSAIINFLIDYLNKLLKTE